MGAIPKWGWILFLIVAFDDILLWLSSPALAIPLTIILLVIGGVFFLVDLHSQVVLLTMQEEQHQPLLDS